MTRATENNKTNLPKMRNPFLVSSNAFKIYQTHFMTGKPDNATIKKLSFAETNDLIDDFQKFYDDTISEILKDFHKLTAPLIKWSQQHPQGFPLEINMTCQDGNHRWQWMSESLLDESPPHDDLMCKCGKLRFKDRAQITRDTPTPKMTEISNAAFEQHRSSLVQEYEKAIRLSAEAGNDTASLMERVEQLQNLDAKGIEAYKAELIEMYNEFGNLDLEPHESDEEADA